MTKQDKYDLLPCVKCGEPVIEFTVSNELWNTIVRRDGPETDQEYLCAMCFGDAVAAALQVQAEDVVLYKTLWEEEKEVYALSVKRENELNAVLRAQGQEIERLTHEWQQAKDAVAHLEQGRPLGELVGKQIIVNMATEITQLKADRDSWKDQTERMWREVNGLRPEKHPEEGWCLRCGLGWDDEKDDNDEHQCPPGFWNDNEKKIAQLKAEIVKLKRSND